MPSPNRKKQTQPPLRRTSTGNKNGNGGRHFLKKKKMPKKPPKQKAYEVTFKNLVPSEVPATSGGGNSKVLQNSVLSGPEEEGTYNRFPCYAVNSEMAQSTNAKSKP